MTALNKSLFINTYTNKEEIQKFLRLNKIVKLLLEFIEILVGKKYSRGVSLDSLFSKRLTCTIHVTLSNVQLNAPIPHWLLIIEYRDMLRCETHKMRKSFLVPGDLLWYGHIRDMSL